MGKISFFALFVQSWHLSFARPQFFVFGCFIALPLASQFLLPLSSDTLDVASLEKLISSHPFLSFTFLGASLASTIFGKSQLIPSLFAHLRPNLSKQTINPSRHLLHFKKIILLEGTVFLFLFCVSIVLISPSLVSLMLFNSIPNTLILLGLLVALPLLILTFFVKKFSLFYFLLSPLRLFPALKRGSLLFLQHRPQSLLFGVFCFMGYLLFTFSLNLVMLGGVVLLQSFSVFESTHGTSFFISLACLTWYAIFSQSLWLTFFMELASPKEKLPEKTALFEEKVLEIPI